MASSPQFIAIPVAAAYSIVPADTTTIKTLYTAPATGARIEHLRCTSIDTAARVVAIYINTGGSDLFIGSFSVALGSSTAPTNADLMAGIMSVYDSKQFILLPPNAILKCAVTVTVTAACKIDVFCDGGSF